MDDNTNSEGVRSSNEAKRSKQTSREDEHTSTCDGGSSRAAVPMNLEGCSVCAPHQQLLLFLFFFMPLHMALGDLSSKFITRFISETLAVKFFMC